MQCLLGLIPSGPIEPHVLGLQPLYQRNSSWVFRVVDPHKLEVVREVLRDTSAPFARLTRLCLLRRLNT